jgi:hypothetical protein
MIKIMETKTIDIPLIGEQRLLIAEPDFIEKVYFEPSSASIYAKHTFTLKPIFIALMPQKYVYLFTTKLITIKSWKIIPENQEIKLKIVLNESTYI